MSPTKIQMYIGHPTFANPIGAAKVVRKVASHSPNEERLDPMCLYSSGGISTLYSQIMPAVEYPKVNTKAQMTAKDAHCVPRVGFGMAMRMMKVNMQRVSMMVPVSIIFRRPNFSFVNTSGMVPRKNQVVTIPVRRVIRLPLKPKLVRMIAR